jgi:hypothetical protein
MISLSQLRKLLAALVLAGMAALMLACSSTDESPETSGSSAGGDSNYMECVAACPAEGPDRPPCVASCAEQYAQ